LQIDVRQTGTGDPLEFRVVVTAGNCQTRHRVTMRRAAHERLAGRGICAEDCVRAAFEFLLEREPPEEILPRFDIEDVGRFFPDFAADLQRRLARRR